MRKILLISSSKVYGSGYLDHCSQQIDDFLEGIETILFVPFALADHEGYAAQARQRFAKMGRGLDSLHEAPDPRAAVAEAQAMFIGGGNTFRLLKALVEAELVGPIRQRVAGGMPYMGSSAGSNVACLTIKTTNDMPIVYPPTFDALGLVPFNLNPHYLDPDPDSPHMGETREARIREFHELNKPPVLGLREGALLRVDGGRAELQGSKGARLFQQGEEATEYSPGEDLSFLLEER
ncbi:MAG: dipeptidase PepE [Deltaproteobacteria bacterium]|nr:dipeptidase PepE [Deltaproteobacteria bacterium]